jgi:glutamate-1-semialdehyde 2,1-aminomutase
MQNDHPAGLSLGPKDWTQGAGQRLYRHAKTRIPGGTQLLSKRPEMFLPDLWPAYYQKAAGAEVWDLDGNHYFDFTHNGVGSCLLGYADPDVNAAVKTVIDAGSMASLNAPEEVELADLLCQLHPWADMVRYARTGGEAMSIAVRLTRAVTRRDKVAFCGYHGWNDWYLAANLGESSALDGHLMPGLSPGGVPRALQGTALPFRYNDLESLRSIVAKHKNELAGIIMEPLRSDLPESGFLAGVRTLADESGALLVFDEITAGFRLTTGGAHLVLGVEPDLAVFAKGMSNGYAMAAILGRGKYMTAAQESFISSTYWTERIGPVAALATIRKHIQLNLSQMLAEKGQRVREIWSQAAAQAELKIKISGILPLPAFSFDHPEFLASKTFFSQSLLELGYLASNAVYVTYAHTPALLAGYESAVNAAFQEIAALLMRGDGSLEARLQGPLSHTGFARLT